MGYVVGIGSMLAVAWLAVRASLLVRYGRRIASTVAACWRVGTCGERCALVCAACLMAVPLPGPFDELAAAAILARVARRQARAVPDVAGKDVRRGARVVDHATLRLTGTVRRVIGTCAVVAFDDGLTHTVAADTLRRIDG